MKPTERNTKILAVLMAALGLALFTPSLASAEFSRPYITLLTGTPTGPSGELVPFERVPGLADDPGGDVYIVDASEFSFVGGVDEFNSSNEFVEQLASISASSLAFDDTSGKLKSAAGKSGEGNNFVAVDNSTSLVDEARGDVYITYATLTGESGGHLGFLRRLNPSGGPAPFTCLEDGKSPGYINGAGELTGAPGETWGEYEKAGTDEMMRGVAVDSGSGASAGDVYVVVNNTHYENPVIAPHLDEFTPAGCFVREFTGAMVPETENGNHNEYVFSQGVDGVAADPTDGDVLIESYDSFWSQRYR